MIRDCDGELAADIPAATVQQVFMRRMIYLSLSDKLADLTIRDAGKGPIPGVVESSLFGFRPWRWLQKSWPSQTHTGATWGAVKPGTT